MYYSKKKKNNSVTIENTYFFNNRKTQRLQVKISNSNLWLISFHDFTQGDVAVEQDEFNSIQAMNLKYLLNLLVLL